MALTNKQLFREGNRPLVTCSMVVHKHNRLELMRPWLWNENFPYRHTQTLSEFVFSFIFLFGFSFFLIFSSFVFVLKEKNKRDERFQWRKDREKGSQAKFKTRQWRWREKKRNRVAWRTIQDMARSIITTNQRRRPKRRSRRVGISNHVMWASFFVWDIPFIRSNQCQIFVSNFVINLSPETDFRNARSKIKLKQKTETSQHNFFLGGWRRVQGRD